MRWLLSHNCNARCLHCSYFGSPDERNHDIDYDHASRIIAVLCDGSIEISALQLLGGEPLLWPHLRKILVSLSHANIATELVTNGTLINSDFINFLHGVRLSSLCFSIDGINEVTFGLLRHDIEFNGVINNLILATSNKPPWQKIRVNYVLASGNCGDPSEIVNFFESLGVDIVTFSPVLIHGKSNHIMLESTEFVNFAERYAQSFNDYKIETHIKSKPLLTYYLNTKYKAAIPMMYSGCPAGTSDIAITSDGSIDVCPKIVNNKRLKQHLDLDFYKIENSIKSILDLQQVRDIQKFKGRVAYNEYTPCSSCALLRNWCEPCFIEGALGEKVTQSFCHEVMTRLNVIHNKQLHATI